MVHQTEMAIQFTAVTDFVEKHRRGVLMTLGAAALAGLVVGLWSSSRAEKALAARDALHQALSANQEDAIARVSETFAGTRSAFDASMELGKRAAEKKDWTAAISHYERASKNPPSKLDGSLAAIALGRSYQAAGRLDEASKHLGLAMTKADPAVLPEVLWVLSSVKRASNDREGAKPLLNRILAEFADTEYASKAREALGSKP